MVDSHFYYIVMVVWFDDSKYLVAMEQKSNDHPNREDTHFDDSVSSSHHLPGNQKHKT